MKDRSLVKIDIPAALEFLPPARLAISGLANQANFSVQEIQEIKDAFSDACRFALQNAYSQEETNNKLSVKCHVSKEELKICIEHEDINICIKRKRKK